MIFLKIIPWGGKRFKDQILRRILETRAGVGGANKTQIVYSCGLNFHTVVPYLELITRNGLAVKVDGTTLRYKTTAKGEEALRCLRELEELMPELGEDISVEGYAD